MADISERMCFLCDTSYLCDRIWLTQEGIKNEYHTININVLVYILCMFLNVDVHCEFSGTVSMTQSNRYKIHLIC